MQCKISAVVLPGSCAPRELMHRGMWNASVLSAFKAYCFRGPSKNLTPAASTFRASTSRLVIQRCSFRHVLSAQNDKHLCLPICIGTFEVLRSTLRPKLFGFSGSSAHFGSDASGLLVSSGRSALRPSARPQALCPWVVGLQALGSGGFRSFIPSGSSAVQLRGYLRPSIRLHVRRIEPSTQRCRAGSPT